MEGKRPPSPFHPALCRKSRLFCPATEHRVHLIPGPGQKKKRQLAPRKSLTYPWEPKSATATSWRGNTSNYSELLDYISQDPLTGSDVIHSRPRSNFPESTKAARFVFSRSGRGNTIRHAQRWIMLFYFLRGANNPSALSRSGSSESQEASETTRPRMLSAAELPTCLQFYFSISRWSMCKPSGACSTWPFFFFFFFFSFPDRNWKYVWKSKWQIIVKAWYVWRKNRDRKRAEL